MSSTQERLAIRNKYSKAQFIQPQMFGWQNKVEIQLIRDQKSQKYTLK